MFSRLFGRKKELQDDIPATTTGDWGFLKTDMHSHLVPGIDDGAQTVEESLALITHLKELGFTSVVTTPHIKTDHYPNTPETIYEGLQLLDRAMKERGVFMPIRAAAEYYIDDHFMQLLEDGEPLLTISDNRELLVEFSFMFEPVRLFETLFRIQTAGYRPILAHPERYGFFHDKPNIYKELRQRGYMLQLNTISLSGYYGKTVKLIAEKLLAEGLYDYCGSDMHHDRHAQALRNMLGSRHMAILEAYPFLNAKLAV